MSFDAYEEFEERFRRMMAEARRIEERLIKVLKEFEQSENCLVPLHELKPTSDGYKLEVDLPGVEKSEVSLTLKESSVVIRAPCRSTIAARRKAGKEPYYFIEIPLPSDVDMKSVRATMKNGLLKLEMKKKGIGYEIKVD